MNSVRRAFIYPILISLPFLANSIVPTGLLAQTKNQSCIEPLRVDEPFNLAKAVERSKLVVVVRYKGLKGKKQSISYYCPPIAVYECLETLKGEVPSRRIDVRYEFHNRDNSGKPKAWIFESSLLPKKNSTWILLIDDRLEDTYETIGGQRGRIRFDVENRNKITDLLKQ